jgi:HlyB family type I secretion system ABC transporter
MTTSDPSVVPENLPLLSFLPPDVRDLVAARFEPQSFQFGDIIVREGEPAGAFYVLVSGRARVVKQGLDNQEVSLNVLRAGDSFGEMALLEHTTRTATVRASGDVQVLRLDRSAFEALVADHPAIRASLDLRVRHRSLHNLIRLYSAFTRLPLPALQILLAELRPVSLASGELVIRQGDEPGPMYVVEEGRLRVFVQEDGTRRYLSYLRKGDFFGEVSLFKQAPRAASVETVSPCKLLELAESTFRKLIAGYPQFRAAIEERVTQYDYKAVARVPLDFEEELLPAEAAIPEQVALQQTRQIEPAEVDEDEGPFASEEGFVKKSGRIRRMPFVAQIDEVDCGAACLAMICRFYGRAVSLTRIRQLAHTSIDGTNLQGLCLAAEALGLAARSVKASKRNLDDMPLPAIVHWEGNHWLVVYDVTDKRVRVADPALGRRRLPRADFEARWTGYTALFDYTDKFEQAPEGRPGFAWLWPLLRPYAPLLAKTAALAAMISALQILLPVITQVIVDRVLVDHDVGLLRILIIAMIGVLAFVLLAVVVQRYLLSFVAVRVDAVSLDYLARRLLALPFTYFGTRRTGDIQRRLAGMRHVREFVVENGVRALSAGAQLIAVLILMFVYSPLLAGVFLITAPLYGLLMRISRGVLRPIFANLEEAFGRYNSHQVDAIKGIETVKTMGAESALRQVMLGEFHGLAGRQFKADFTIMSYEGAVNAVTFLSLVLFLWAGALQVMNGALTIGGLVAFNSLVAMANAPISVLLSLWDNLQYCGVLLTRLDDIFGQQPEQGFDHSHLVPVRTLEGRIRFQNVGFQYGGPASPMILEGISFEIPPGKMVALVGRSGSGKTTLVKCMAALLEPTEGAILYDGLDLRTLRYRDLRRQIGFVLQETYLFDDTIARNIAFGEDEPNLDQVIWAARVANAHEFVERLPFGYDTRVGESGLSLSGGQRQRIAIARALYHRPPVLVFDEATSSLDTESERAVQENIDQLVSGHTSIVIAHRLSTVRNADVILVIEKGRLVEQGTHDELMARRGCYFYLCSQQLGL